MSNTNDFSNRNQMAPDTVVRVRMHDFKNHLQVLKSLFEIMRENPELLVKNGDELADDVEQAWEFFKEEYHLVFEGKTYTNS